MSINDINNSEYFVNHYNSLQRSKNNGRIDILSNNFNNSVFKLYDRIPIESHTTEYREALTGTFEPNLLSTLYFSQENIKTIHHSIMFGVYKMSNNTYKIGYQNEDTLKIIMRSIFLQHSKNQEYNITKQLEQLNKMVIDYCVNQIYNEAKGYMKFKSDVSNLAVPMNRPVSTYHSNNLELKKFF
tara:strand:+ start:91 stop:645 length:555 start_codon:yes stop_codon:yes gene_type:complete